MSRWRREGTLRWVLLGVGVAVVFIAVAILASSEEETPELPPPERGALGARVDWSEPDEGKPTAVVMVIHGGAWQPNPAEFESLRTQLAPNLNRAGYATVAIGYDAGEQGYGQIEAVYEEAKERYPGLPVCAFGVSAGANLSLVLATNKPDLACVIGMATPTDLTTIAEQGGEEAYDQAVAAFGRDRLQAFSPALHADQIRARVLLIAAESDPIVPPAQSEEFKEALPSAEVSVYPEGDAEVFWAHFGGVEPGADEEVAEQELAFLDEAAKG